MNLNSQKIPAIVISDLGSHRSDPLVKVLRQEPEIEIEMVNAVIVQQIEDVDHSLIQVDQNLAQCYLGRSLLPGEIGCAKSHNIAREMISSSKMGGIIFEDDARVTNVESIVRNARSFLEENQDKAAILSLSGWKPRKYSANEGVPKKIDSRFIRLLGVPPLALAYVITPAAAKLLKESNSVINTVADWPFSKCKFFLLDHILAFHGDENTVSLIEFGQLRKNGRNSMLTRFKFFFFVEYFKITPRRVSFRKYLDSIWKRKLLFYVDNARMLIKMGK